MQGIQFDYFHGMEAEKYSFYRIPKMLFTVECFRSLSCEAKILYGLMLDRMGLSIKNRWFDEEDRIYIVFTVEEIAELMDCGMQKAVKLVKELDVDKGIGLIEKKRLGLGKPNVIYVKNFMTKDDFHLPGQGGIPVNEHIAQEGAEINASCIEATETEETSSIYLSEAEAKESKESISGIVEIKNQELLKSQFKNFQNHNLIILNLIILILVRLILSICIHLM